MVKEKILGYNISCCGKFWLRGIFNIPLFIFARSAIITW